MCSIQNNDPPKKKKSEWAEFGVKETKIFSDFYGKPRTDVFQGCEVHVPNVIHPPDQDELVFFKLSMEDAKETHQAWLEDKLAEMRITSSESEMQHFHGENKCIPVSKAYKLIQSEAELFPNILRLFQIALLIPTSTAEVERGFSLFNLLCTDLRSTLSQKNLESLVRINLKRHALTDKDWESVIDVFNRKPRRINL